jgi:abhydrolase domain-containing protein 6
MPVSETVTTNIDLDGHAIRVWRKGVGPKIGFFAGYGGLPRWIPFLDALAEHRTVIVPSLPGFPGGGRAQLDLDTHLDWIVAARRIFMAAGLEGCDLIGSSVGGSLAAEIAALWPGGVRRLVLVAPLGLYLEANPPTDIFAQRADEYAALLCANPDNYLSLKTLPNDADRTEWEIDQARASEAAARLLWPLASTRLEKRLPLIQQPTLVVRGELDRVMPRAYADHIANSIAGTSNVEIIAGAGHLVELDAPAALARSVIAFTQQE